MEPVTASAKRPRRMSGWAAFGVIAVLGVLLAFSFLSFAGPLAWPIVIIVGAVVIWARPSARDWLGLVAGIGAFLLFIAAIHINDTRCPPSGTTIVTGPGGSYSCGGLDSKPWLIVGMIVFGAGIGLYTWARRKVMTVESP